MVIEYAYYLVSDSGVSTLHMVINPICEVEGPSPVSRLLPLRRLIARGGPMHLIPNNYSYLLQVYYHQIMTVLSRCIYVYIVCIYI